MPQQNHNQAKPRLLLADDHQIVIDGLRTLLSTEYELCGTAANGLDLVKMAEALKPDVVVADISMPLLNGIDAVAQLRAQNERIKVVFLTMHPDVTYLSKALAAGASGYVLKHAASDELLAALRAVMRGETYVSPQLQVDSVREMLLNPAKRQGKGELELTPRQRAVLQLLAEGKSAKEIGAALDISPRTVETHKYKMMDDLGVKTTAQLVQHAVRIGLVTP